MDRRSVLRRVFDLVILCAIFGALYLLFSNSHELARGDPLIAPFAALFAVLLFGVLRADEIIYGCLLREYKVTTI